MWWPLAGGFDGAVGCVNIKYLDRHYRERGEGAGLGQVWLDLNE